MTSIWKELRNSQGKRLQRGFQDYERQIWGTIDNFDGRIPPTIRSFCATDKPSFQTSRDWFWKAFNRLVKRTKRSCFRMCSKEQFRDCYKYEGPEWLKSELARRTELAMPETWATESYKIWKMGNHLTTVSTIQSSSYCCTSSAPNFPLKWRRMTTGKTTPIRGRTFNLTYRVDGTVAVRVTPSQWISFLLNDAVCPLSKECHSQAPCLIWDTPSSFRAMLVNGLSTCLSDVPSVHAHGTGHEVQSTYWLLCWNHSRLLTAVARPILHVESVIVFWLLSHSLDICSCSCPEIKSMFGRIYKATCSRWYEGNVDQTLFTRPLRNNSSTLEALRSLH